MREKNMERQARSDMEAAKAASEKKFSNNSLPRRYRLYDKIKDHVSLRTVDIIITVTALLIVGFLIYGIITANPQQ